MLHKNFVTFKSLGQDKEEVKENVADISHHQISLEAMMVDDSQAIISKKEKKKNKEEEKDDEDDKMLDEGEV